MSSKKKRHAHDFSSEGRNNTSISEKASAINYHKPFKRSKVVSQEALALSSQLKHFSINKQVEEAVALYRSTPKEIRDGHHLAILVDCCARCGAVDLAESLVQEETATSPNCNLSVQCQTALLKGYAHAGNMIKAGSLFESMVRSSSSGNQKPNVRTLNTLLRGCMWTAASNVPNVDRNGDVPSTIENVVGGVVSCQKALLLVNNHYMKSNKTHGVELDLSSFEYSTMMLCQALQCKDAELQIQEMKLHHSQQPNDESLATTLVALARAYALLGKTTEAIQNAELGIASIQNSFATNSQEQQSSSNETNNNYNDATGGKRSWKQNGANNNKASSFINNTTDQNEFQSSRREESNLLFRKHRLTELNTEANGIRTICQQFPDRIVENGLDKHGNKGLLAKYLLTRLLYFSGGGTTSLVKGCDGTENKKTENVKNSIEELREQLLVPLWFSFGLAAALKRPLMQIKQPMEKMKGEAKSINSNAIWSKKDRAAINKFLGGNKKAFEDILGNDGYINFDYVFTSLNDQTNMTTQKMEGTPLHLELGAGSGDWIITQALCNQRERYVSVELRADRVAQTFAKCVLNYPPDETSESCCDTRIVNNVCIIGAECRSLLGKHIHPKSITTVFVNHPEPPTQTFGSSSSNKSHGNDLLLESILKSEPAHMLHSSTLIEIGRCLVSNGKGRLVIVTDNRWYARLLCATLQKVMLTYSTSLFDNVPMNSVKNFFKLDTFNSRGGNCCDVSIYEGKPSEQIGHCIPKHRSDNGSSYFDRLWMAGAGKHAEMKKRFIIVMQSSGQNKIPLKKDYKKSQNTTFQKKTKKPNKKRSKAKQEKRNQKRLEQRRLEAK